MAEQTFRSAFNGFNREDVVRYLEYINAQHTAEVNQLRSELEFLRSKDTKEPTPTAVCENTEVIEQQAARIRELFDLSKKQEQTIAELNARLEAAPQEKIGAGEELEAYRRAERAERVAQERADEVYRQVNSVLADATVKIDEASSLINSMADQVSGQLAAFQSAVATSKQTLSDAAAIMYAIRPNPDNQ